MDTYSTSFRLSIAPVSQAAFRTLAVRLRTDPGVAGFEWTSSEFNRSFETEVNNPSVTISESVSILAKRDATTRFLVLCLVAIPLVLIVLLAILLWRGSRPSVEGLVGVTAIMFAILPIRSVLVPSEISSLTLVDFALASEMAVLAAGAAIVYLWPRR